MKKSLLLSMLTFFCLVSGSAWAQTFTQGDLKFTVIDAEAKTVSVAKDNNYIEGDLVLPSTVSNEGVTYTVTTVANDGFASTNISTLTVPATVTALGNKAFRNCHSLTYITFQDGSEPLSIVCGDNASFGNTNADKSVYIGRNITTNANTGAFPNAVSVEFGSQVTTIWKYLFYDASKLSSLVIGNGVKTIGEYAFKGSGDNTDYVGELSVTMGENVETVTLPSTLKVIEGYAFSSTGLTGISIPASVDSIGYGSFGYNPNMTWIRIEDSTKPLKMWRGTNYGTFRNLTADKSVYVGRDLELSGDSQITIVSNATSIEIGDQVTTINPYMFYDANKLSSLVIGNGRML